MKPKSPLVIVVERTTYLVTPKGIFPKQIGEKSVRICGPVRFIERRKILGCTQVLVVIRMRDQDGVWKNLEVHLSDVHSSGRLIDLLLDAGFYVSDKKAAAAVIRELYIQHPPQKSIWATQKPGWNTVESHDVYVTNQGAFKPSDCNAEVVLAEGICAGFATSGTLEDWNLDVGKYCVGNPVLQMGVCLSLAGLLLHLSGLPNFGILIFGPSKTGKTVSLRISASVTGSANNILNWNATSNALQVSAIQRNDGLLPLDEIGQGDPASVSAAVYDLMNGRTKSRLGSDIKYDPGTIFRVVVLATGEHDLREHLHRAGKEVKTGQLVRLLSLPVPESGIFQELHGYHTAAGLASAIVQNVGNYHGALGVAFLEHIAEHQSDLKAKLPIRIRKIAGYLLTCLDSIPDHGTYDHVAKSFALAAIAGEMAITAGLLAWKPSYARKAVKWCFLQWAKNEARIAETSDDAIFLLLQRFFQSEKAGKFLPWADFEASKGQGTIAGYMHQVDGSEAYLIYPAYFETILCAKFGKAVAIRVLKHYQLLVLGARNTPTKQISIPKAKQRDSMTKASFYVIRDEILRTSLSA